MLKTIKPDDGEFTSLSRSGYYLAIDPGETTGLAHGMINLGKPLVNLVQIDTSCGLYLTWQTLTQIKWHSLDAIICESFQHRQRDRVSYAAPEAIGVVKLFCELYHIPLIMQSPSYGKGFFDNKKLTKLEVYKTGMPHANDAARHLLQFWMNQSWLDLNLLK